MTRNDVYNEVKRLGLTEDIKRVFGRNFTQVSTDNLIRFINNRCVGGSTIVSHTTIIEPDYKALYTEAIAAIAKLLVAIPETLFNDVNEMAKQVTKETSVKEIDFSKMSVDELKKQFGN